MAGTYGDTVRIPQDAEVTVKLGAWTYDAGAWSLTGPDIVRGGTWYDLTLDLPNPGPHGGVEVTFSVDAPGVEAPDSRSLREGDSGTFTVPFLTPDDVNGPVTVTVDIADVGTRSHTIEILPGLKSIELPWPLKAEQTFEGTLNLGTVTDEPVTVTLSSDNPTLQVPAEVVVPAGASSVSFTGTTGAVTGWGENARVTAELDGTFATEDVFIQLSL